MVVIWKQPNLYSTKEMYAILKGYRIKIQHRHNFMSTEEAWKEKTQMGEYAQSLFCGGSKKDE